MNEYDYWTAYQKDWNAGAKFFSDYWYLHPKLTKEQAYQNASNYANQHFTHMSHVTQYINGMEKKLQENVARDALAGALFGKLSKSGEHFFFTDPKSGRTLLTAFVKSKKVDSRGNIEKLIPRAQKWLHEKASAEEKGEFGGWLPKLLPYDPERTRRQDKKRRENELRSTRTRPERGRRRKQNRPKRKRRRKKRKRP